MKYIKQFLIIVLVSCIGEVLHFFIPLPIPASIYALILMLGLLICKILPLNAVAECADFLLKIMPIMFIPAAVGLIVYWEQLKQMLLPFCIITIVSTLLTILTTGKVTDLIVSRNGGNENE